MKIPSFLMTVGTVLSASAFGQVAPLEKVPYPGGQIPANAPKFAKWSVTVTQKNESGTTDPNSAPAQGEPVEKRTKSVVTVVKTLPLRSVTISTLGQESRIWCVDQFQVHQGPGGTAGNPGANPLLYSSVSFTFIDFSHSDFPELAWISEKNFAGLRTVGEQQYLIFNDQLVELTGAIIPNQGDLRQGEASGSSAPRKMDTTAVIDAQTRLPVSMRKGLKNYVYKFDEPPVSEISLPAEVKATLAAEQNRVRRLARTPQTH